MLNQVTSGDYEVKSVESILDGQHMVYYISSEGDPRQAQVWSIKSDGSGKQKLSTVAGVHETKFAPASPTYIDGRVEPDDPASGEPLSWKQSARLSSASKPLACRFVDAGRIAAN